VTTEHRHPSGPGDHQRHWNTADNQHSRGTVAGTPDRGPTGGGATGATAGRVREESKNARLKAGMK
jgi:hypothetical protein